MRVMLGGGGTAGHVTPALATAEALRALRPDLEVEFAGSAKGLEARIVPAEGWPFHEIVAAPVRRGRSLGALRANASVPFVVVGAARRLARLLRAREVGAVCTFGGYVSGPLALAARLAGIPLVLHEQNAIPGLANRIAARWARTVAVSVPGVEGRFPHPERVVLTGNPVRTSLAPAELPALRAAAVERFGLDPGRRTLLAFGGSLGARRLNDALLAAAASWPDADGVQVLHATGRDDYERVEAGWRDASPRSALRVHCVPFIERMDLAYAVADLVLCRSGASTIAELTVLGLPSVLVPYPHAAAGEQHANALALAERDAAVLVPDEDMDGPWVAGHLAPLLADGARRARMSAAARALGRPAAATEVATLVLAASGAIAERRR